MPGKGAAIGFLALVGLYLYSTGAIGGGDGQVVYADGSTDIGDLLPIADPQAALESSEGDATGDLTDMTAIPDSGADPLAAFRYMVMSCENNALDVSSGMAFQRFYGGATFYNMSDHPVLTGELKGVPLPPQTCINAGIPSGNCVATAAGAWQINVPTWQQFRNPGDAFDAAGQANCTDNILASLGVPNMLANGDLQGAIKAAGRRWASLPGAIGQQGQRTLDFALNAFNTAPATVTA